MAILNDVSSARSAVAVDVSVSDQDLALGCRGLYIGTAGNIVVDLPGASSITFTNVPVGILPIQATQVYNSGTTAAGIVALF